MQFLLQNLQHDFRKLFSLNVYIICNDLRVIIYIEEWWSFTLDIVVDTYFHFHFHPIYIAWEYFTLSSGTPGSDRPVSTFNVETEQQWEFLPSHPSWPQKVRKLLSSSGFPDMLFSFKNKYHYTYLNTYIALYFSYAKVTCNTHKQPKEFGFHPSYARSLIS